MVLIDGIRRGRGSGSSKKEAEGAAALEALDRMGYTTNGVILNKKDVYKRQSLPRISSRSAMTVRVGAWSRATC